MTIPTLLRAAHATAMLIASSTIAPKIMFAQGDPSSGTVTVTVTDAAPYVGCAAWTYGQWGLSLQQLATTGFDGWPVKAVVACNRNSQPVRTLRVRSTTWVKGLGIICDEP